MSKDEKERRREIALNGERNKGDPPHKIVKVSEVQDRRLQKMIDKSMQDKDPVLPLGKMMIAHSDFLKEQDRQNKQK